MISPVDSCLSGITIYGIECGDDEKGWKPVSGFRLTETRKHTFHQIANGIKQMAPEMINYPESYRLMYGFWDTDNVYHMEYVPMSVFLKNHNVEK